MINKPLYNSPEYWKAVQHGFISWDQVATDEAEYQSRRAKSLQTCHRYKLIETASYSMPVTNEYVPEMSARIDLDENLTDGAKTTLRFIIRKVYQQAREDREIYITVSYIAKGRGRHTRTIQRHLRQIEKAGYIISGVVQNFSTRMVQCLKIVLQKAIFPKHHQKQWPQKLSNSGATFTPDKQSHIYNIETVRVWAENCMNGVFKSFMKTKPLFDMTKIAA